MATSEVEQPAVNGTEKHETIENVTAEQPAPESAPEKEAEPSTAPAVANGEELKKQKNALRFRVPKNLRNLFAKKTDATQNGENGQLNGHHENGQNGHPEAHEEAKAPDAVSIGCAGKMRNVFKKVKPGHVDKRPIDKTEENAKPGNEDSKKEKLEAIVKNNLLGAGLVDRAAVCTQDGLIAANSCEFHPTAEQVKDVVKLINAKPEDAVGKSLKVADKEYVCAESVEGNSLLGKHQPKVEEDAAPVSEAAPDSFVLIQLAQTHVVIAEYSAVQSSITHADDLKAAMNEITKTLRDDGL